MRCIEQINTESPEREVLGKQGQVDIFAIDERREPHLIVTRELPNSLLRQLGNSKVINVLHIRSVQLYKLLLFLFQDLSVIKN